MSQADCVKILKKEGKWLNAEYIARKCGICKSTITSNMSSLIKFNEVKRRKVRSPINNCWSYEYKLK